MSEHAHKSAIYPGTFDPITKGHSALVERAARLFDRVVVAVAANPGKQSLFTLEERQNLTRAALADYDNVEVCTFDGLLALEITSIPIKLLRL